MNRSPIQGTRGLIISKLEAISNIKSTQKSKSGLSYYIAQLEDSNKNICNICIIRLPNGYLIETDYPNQDSAYERLWMADPDLGRITYVESSNPDLKTKFDYFNIPLKQAESLEFHALPSDLDFLVNLLDHAIRNDNSVKQKNAILASDFKLLKAIN